MENSKKVTLKVGDVFYRADTDCWFEEDFIISSFHGREIKYLNGAYGYFSQYGEYIVNGYHYVAEDVLLPDTDIKENHDSDCSLHNEPAYPNGDCSVSCEEITPENLHEVLQYNNICQSKYTFTNTGLFINGCNRIDLNNPNLIKHVMVEFGRLKPLPKKINNLLEWWEQNKSDGFYLALPLCKKLEMYELSLKGESLAFIPTEWSLERQINAVQQLINIYKGDTAK